MTGEPAASPAPITTTVGEPTLKRVLGVPGLLLFGLTYLAPVAVFTTYGSVAVITDGHLPSAYLVALVVMLFTSVSYAHMVRAYPVAGSAYTYTNRTFGPHIGFMTGWTLMLDYLFLPMINFLLVGIYLHAQFPSVPQWIFTLATVVLVFALNVLGIELMNRVNLVVIAATMVLIVVFVVLALAHIGNHGADQPLEPFLPPDGHPGLVFSGAAILALGFLGFDAVSTLSEEAREPRRAIPRAIILTTVVGGLIFIVVAWMGSLVHPGSTFDNPDVAGVEIMKDLGGSAWGTIFVAVYVAGAFGSGMAAQASVARIIYSMGRDGTLPTPLFGRLHRRLRTPVGAITVVSAVGLVALWISLDNAVVMISFGASVAFSMVNLAVVKHYVVDGRRRSGIDLLVYALGPVIGFALTAWLWTKLSGVSFTVGLAWLAAGVIYLLVLTRGLRVAPPAMDLSESTDGAAVPESSARPR